MAWTAPITWAIRDPITAAKLNANVRDNVNYLYARPRHIVTIPGNSADLTTTSTTFAAIDDAQFTLTVTPTGGLMNFWLSAFCAQSANTSFIYFDIIIDDVTYVSSQTATALTNGIWSFKVGTAATIETLPAAPFVYPVVLTANTPHTFKLRWRVTATTGTLKLTTNFLCQFGAREI